MTQPQAGLARLLGDNGGTNARLAWQAAEGTPSRDVVTLPCAGFASLGDAMQTYIAQLRLPRPASPTR